MFDYHCGGHRYISVLLSYVVPQVHWCLIIIVGVIIIVGATGRAAVAMCKVISMPASFVKKQVEFGPVMQTRLIIVSCTCKHNYAYGYVLKITL